jgi:hypothetical protein
VHVFAVGRFFYSECASGDGEAKLFWREGPAIHRDIKPANDVKKDAPIVGRLHLKLKADRLPILPQVQVIGRMIAPAAPSSSYTAIQLQPESWMSVD